MDPSRMRGMTERLCADDCDGRLAGSPGGARARAIIAAGLEQRGVEVWEQPVPRCGGGNIVARIGSGAPAVVIGAHHDHLGGAFRGADDNAAAVALLVELCRALAQRPPERGTILLVAFDAEEPPHFLGEGMGSMVFAAHPPLPRGDIRLAIVLDLVGHAVGPPAAPSEVRDSLFVLGAEKTAGLAALVSEAGGAGPVVRMLGLDLIPPLSDYAAFRALGVPSLFLTCGRWRHYHEPTDTPDRLDYDKLARIGDFVERLARAVLVAPAGRHDDSARYLAGSAATLLALARALGGGRAITTLERIERSARDGSLSAADYLALLEGLALLEQGLA